MKELTLLRVGPLVLLSGSLREGIYASESQQKVPTTQLAKMSIDLKFVELTADVLEIIL